MNSEKSIYELQLEIVQLAFKNGLCSQKLEKQPAPWVLKGLEVLESGEELTPEMIKKFNLSGGTDHPDPWFG